MFQQDNSISKYLSHKHIKQPFVSQNNINNQVDEDGEKVGNKEKKKFTISKNIDTYKDENAPTLKAKFKNIKEKLGNIFAKISTEDNKEIKNPIYRL